jgi:hypothetical protein
VTPRPDDELTSDPLLRAWLLGVAAVGPLFIAIGAGALALDPEGDTAPIVLAVMALPFLVSGAIVTTFAGLLLARSELYRWVASHRPLLPAIVAAALLLVPAPFLDAASGTDDVSLLLLILSATELSIALTWLAAARVALGLAATVALGVALLVAAGSAD